MTVVVPEAAGRPGRRLQRLVRVPSWHDPGWRGFAGSGRRIIPSL